MPIKLELKQRTTGSVIVTQSFKPYSPQTRIIPTCKAPIRREMRAQASSPSITSTLTVNCLCGACQYEKQKQRKTNSNKTVAREEIEGAISVDIVNAGQRVSVDLYVSTVRGHLLELYGKEKTDKQFTAIFVDHQTSPIFYHSSRNS